VATNPARSGSTSEAMVAFDIGVMSGLPQRGCCIFLRVAASSSPVTGRLAIFWNVLRASVVASSNLPGFAAGRRSSSALRPFPFASGCVR
jgi:hypothetical protein